MRFTTLLKQGRNQYIGWYLANFETAMQHRADIQILRGVAVLLVVLYHLGLPLLRNGFLGVDIFFVISGYLMALLYRPGATLDFYRRRASRLLPAYFATVLLTLVASVVLTLPSEQSQVAEQGLFAAAFASNIGFWLNNSYFSKAEFTPLLHLWSLGVELQFYVIVPLLAWLHARGKWTVGVLAILSLLACLILVNISPKTSFFIMPLRVWQFLAGVAVAHYLTSNGSIRYAAPGAGLLALLGVLVLVFVFPMDAEATSLVRGHPSVAAVLITIGTAAVLITGLPNRIIRSWLGIALHRLGDWSYSIYLAHFPVIVLTLYVPFSGTSLEASGWSQLAVIVGAIALASAALNLLFDRRRPKWSSPLVPLSLAALTAVLSVASVPLNRAGYNADDLSILTAFGDRAPYRCGMLVRVLDPRAQLCDLTPDLAKGSPALVLIGDSHADAIKTSFANVARGLGYRFISPFRIRPSSARPEPRTYWISLRHLVTSAS